MRLSLGATRARLIRQLLTESLLLASIGGALGILVGHWGNQLLPGTAGHPMPLDWRVLAFVLGVTHADRRDVRYRAGAARDRMNVSAALKETSRAVAGSRSILSQVAARLQVAISLVLLVGAGLFLRTLHNLRQRGRRVQPARTCVLFRVNPRLNRYDDARMTPALSAD